MRILPSDQENKTFADALLRVGNGALNVVYPKIFNA